MSLITEMAIDIIQKGEQVVPGYMEAVGWPKSDQPKIEFVCEVTLETPMGGDDLLHISFAYLDDAGDTTYGGFTFLFEDGKVVGDF